MKTKIMSLVLIATLAGCGSGGNPFEDEETTTDAGDDTGTDDTTTEGTGIDREGIPPGTTSPSPNESLFRSEAPVEGDGPDTGNGTATGVSYNGADDTFTVDGIALDGDRPYDRGVAVSSLNGGRFQVYDGPATAIDPVSGDVINQFTYRAVYGVSRNRVADAAGAPTTVPTTQFAIVRTGSYIDYGFGGFIYQRDADVTLPTEGEARFTGQSAGLRDFIGRGGLEYSTADVEIIIDFSDFNDSANVLGDGVAGTISNRRVFDLAGNDITAETAGRISDGLTEIPSAVFSVGPDVLDVNGDLVGEMTSTFVDDEGNVVSYETGNYYAIVSGDDPDEIVGVFVVENSLDYEGATTRDTSGFIVYRGDPITP
ncbi:hypothetical protein [Sulfitobacter sp. S190]|uniref:hypothetical protein n=1 Tax=Sulfitobacter sp. S190 TaxID=2867022 RepID=UPI0021A5EDA8|nr:hypothetical protein [Sulfitobacter sp. S190]UWR21476.1 hypothetical protein K3756_12290 [Sulfitobacter sp. S190]